MRIRKELVVILYVFIFLVNDPQLVRAYSFEAGNKDVIQEDTGLDIFMGLDASKIHLVYELNGGTNSNYNRETIEPEELPVQLDVPVRAGYNFAGWYTDCNYTEKITEINSENARNMVLFAKWTKAIDNNYTVEMYSYQTDSVVSRKQKELKECSYTFLDEVEIPGMPSTREKDCMENIISSSNQCLQGICFTPELLLITSYSESKQDLGSLMVFDRVNGTYLATLGMKKESHLGGIAFDGENVWICHSNSNTLERIPYEYILKIAQDAPGYCIDASALSDEYALENIPSCITFYGGRIWVATHTKIFESKMISYNYDSEKDTLIALSSYRIPSKVQGVDFDENGNVYLSTSYGRNNSSYLKVYSSLLALNKRPNDPSVKIEMPPCSEEVAISGECIYVLFESANEKYFEGTDGIGRTSAPIDKVLEVDVASIW
ncbi:MAG: InlB B-repeat-containing protein [Clostridiales bacterium]|nr:InlB B-repeat-containing protein [Clostridiales bacterium]